MLVVDDHLTEDTIDKNEQVFFNTPELLLVTPSP